MAAVGRLFSSRNTCCCSGLISDGANWRCRLEIHRTRPKRTIAGSAKQASWRTSLGKRLANPFMLGGARWSGWLESTSTTPETTAGYLAVKTRTYSPPIDWPTRTYGEGTPARFNSSCRSFAMVVLVRGVGGGSLQPTPARSYQQARVNLATLGCTR